MFPLTGNRVLHVLDHSLPEQSGYAYRSHAILRELQKQGLLLEVVTSPKQGEAAELSKEIDSILYQRTVLTGNGRTSGVTGQLRSISSTRARIAERCRSSSFDLIHAHSPCLNGLAAMRHGVPMVYEMRSSWEDAAVSVGTTSEGFLRYRVSRALETFTVRRADAVVVICEGLRRELLSRGIPDEKITVVPNALPPEVFLTPDAAVVESVRGRYALADAKVIGFFGSYFEWEGLDELVKSLPDVVHSVPEAHLLLAGGGRQEDVLRKLVRDLGLERKVTFAGRVAHDEVMALYRATDVVVFPRVSERLTEMVTPIKPLEAMAQGTIVVASDVGGHKELIKDRETGFLYPAGNREGLAHTIVRVLMSADDLPKVRARAREFVEAERQWSVVSKRYIPMYDALVRRDV